MKKMFFSYLFLLAFTHSSSAINIKLSELYILNNKTPNSALIGKPVRIKKKKTFSDYFTTEENKALQEYIHHCLLMQNNKSTKYYPADYKEIEINEGLKFLKKEIKSTAIYIAKLINNGGKLLFVHESWLSEN